MEPQTCFTIACSSWSAQTWSHQLVNVWQSSVWNKATNSVGLVLAFFHMRPQTTLECVEKVVNFTTCEHDWRKRKDATLLNEITLFPASKKCFDFIVFYDLFLYVFVCMDFPLSFFHTFYLMVPYSHFCNTTLSNSGNTTEIWVIYWHERQSSAVFYLRQAPGWLLALW